MYGPFIQVLVKNPCLLGALGTWTAAHVPEHRMASILLALGSCRPSIPCWFDMGASWETTTYKIYHPARGFDADASYIQYSRLRVDITFYSGILRKFPKNTGPI